MRLQNLPLLTLLAVGLGAPAQAQTTGILPEPVARPTLETVVARLMSFDRNADGRITVDELPERMHGLLARVEGGNRGALDRAEVRRLATSPAAQIPGLNGVQPGVYGFLGSSGFDTSQRIEDAIDDLRLAGPVKERALEIVLTFIAAADANASKDLMAALSQVLSEEQLKAFQAADEGKTVNVPAVLRDGVTFFGARPEEAAGQQRVMVPLRVAPSSDFEVRIAKYPLDADRREQALAAIRRFKAHLPGRVNEAERVALLEQYRGLLTEEQRDDLRAALARPPIVKLNAARNPVRIIEGVSKQTAQPADVVGGQASVLVH